MRTLGSVSHGMRGLRLGLGTAVLAALAACSAGGEDAGALLPVTPDPSGGGGPPVTGTGGGTGAPGPIDGPDLGIGEDPGDLQPQGCQQAQREFKPKIPTVYLLVDRSATMFDTFPGTTDSAWTALRGGALQVMEELQAGVRFGFAAFSGQQTTSPACLMDVPAVPPELNNYEAISTLYTPLNRPTNSESKETPTSLALTQIADELRADTSEGEKYILFVTDGEPDYCDNGNALCPPDSVIALLQRLAAGTDATGAGSFPPIKTLVFGIETPNAGLILPGVLEGFANAGAGQPVAPLVRDPNQVYDPARVYNECNSVAGWRADFMATGKLAMAPATIGTYAADATLAGTAPVYRPDPTDQAALTDEIRLALSSVKSCTFDLGEDGVKVDLSRADLGEKARIIINDVAVPFDPANGWHMISETTVQLEGSACVAWRDPLVETAISFDFPCDIFIPT